MVPGKYDIDIYRGGKLSTVLTATDSGGSDIEFDSYAEIHMQVRPAWVQTGDSDNTALLTLTVANGGIIVADDGLSITLYIGASATAALTFDTGKYDIELITLAPDDIDKFLYGNIAVYGEVTV